MSKTKDEMARCLQEAPKIKKRLKSTEQIRNTANRMKLLAHPTRLHILHILSKQDVCVCVLSEIIGKKQPNISQHLARLKENNIVEDYYIGKLVYYRLKDKKVKEIIASLH